VLGVINSLRIAAGAAGASLQDYLGRGEMLIHGTTHAINAVVTGNTARTAFLTTEGHPDTLVFREGGRMEPFNFTCLTLSRLFQRRSLRDPGAHPGRPLRLPAARPRRAWKVIERLKELLVEAVAVCLLWSIVNPRHELELAELLEEHLAGFPTPCRTKVNPSIREYRRASSTCLDAALKPIMGSYMRGLEARLRDAGFGAGS
jgi:N-methylhydantoinase A